MATETSLMDEHGVPAAYEDTEGSAPVRAEAAKTELALFCTCGGDALGHPFDATCHHALSRKVSSPAREAEPTPAGSPSLLAQIEQLKRFATKDDAPDRYDGVEARAWADGYEDAIYAVLTVLKSAGLREAEPLKALVDKLQRQAHADAVAAYPMFNAEHWRHNAGPDWPEQPDDDSYQAYENCQHPDCVLARSLSAALEGAK